MHHTARTGFSAGRDRLRRSGIRVCYGGCQDETWIGNKPRFARPTWSGAVRGSNATAPGVTRGAGTLMALAEARAGRRRRANGRDSVGDRPFPRIAGPGGGDTARRDPARIRIEQVSLRAMNPESGTAPLVSFGHSRPGRTFAPSIGTRRCRSFIMLIVTGGPIRRREEVEAAENGLSVTVRRPPSVF